MKYSADEKATVWPRAGVSSAAKTLIKRFFELVDLPEDDAGMKLAADVFTTDGIFEATSGRFQGKDIQTCRKHAWTTVRSRHHRVEKVYVNDAAAAAAEVELVIAGRVEIESVGKTTDSHSFVARVELVDAASEAPKIKHYQVLVPASKH